MYIYYKTLLFEWAEQHKVRKKLYKHSHFKRLDEALCSACSSKAAYRISKESLVSRGAENIYAYGETPLSTMARIAGECGITESDHVIELGAGRGRATLFLAEVIGCKVTAYEQIPEFSKVLTEVAHPKIEVIEEDFFFCQQFDASVIYLYGTMLKNEEIELLASRFPRGVKIITVSYPLSDYSDKYETIKSFPGRFPWGKTEIYLQ